jgi:hypothetical protein
MCLWNGILSQSSNPVRISFTNEGEMKTIKGREKLQEGAFSKAAPQEMQKTSSDWREITPDGNTKITGEAGIWHVCYMCKI